jgi:hypothetical protein
LLPYRSCLTPPYFAFTGSPASARGRSLPAQKCPHVPGKTS